jgi:hypothetical protein
MPKSLDNMKLFSLARRFELKYSLLSRADSLQNVVNNIKKDVINMYNLYVNSEKTKEPVLQILANQGEVFSKALIVIMEDMIANIDTYTPVQLFNRINKILGLISEMKKDPENKVRNFIHDAIRVNKDSEKNYREHVKSKFEMVVSRISSILEKQARVLQKLLPKETPLEGGTVEPQRKELSKQKLLDFMRTPAAVSFGLNSLDVMERVLFYPDLKQKLTTLINAIDRGHTPLDGPEVRQATQEIMDNFKSRTQNNSALFGEEK